MKRNYSDVSDRRCETCKHYKVTWACSNCHEDGTEMPPTPMGDNPEGTYQGSDHYDKLNYRNAWMKVHSVERTGCCSDWKKA